MTITKHVDDFINNGINTDKKDSKGVKYARRVLRFFRLSVMDKNKKPGFKKKHPLFCTYNGKRFRVTGASRLGDIWLTTDFTKEVGYELRVDVSDCSEWAPYASMKYLPSDMR